MGATFARNIGLLLALALVVFLVYKHLQTAPSVSNVGGAFSAQDDTMFGNGVLQPLDLVAGNPNY